MKGAARRTARLAVLSALGAVLLLLANVLPSGRLALLALASFPVCAALMLYGAGCASAVFAVTAALGFLLFPDTLALGYAAFFGYYPIVKSLAERVKSKWLVVGLKAALYIVVFAAYWLLARSLFPAVQTLPWYALFLAGAAAFAVYDWCYSMLIQLYIDKLARYFE